LGRYLKKRKWILLSLALLIPLGLLTKMYEGPGGEWVNNSLGGVLYVIFWTLLCSLLFPVAKPCRIAGVVLLVTCMLEVVQLWHPPFLETVRSTFIGVTLLGNSFSWLDFPHYMLGSLVSCGLLYLMAGTGTGNEIP
jgi:hypothetical protein